MQNMRLLRIIFIATCCCLTAAKDRTKPALPAQHSALVEAPVLTSDTQNNEMESGDYIDHYDYEGSIDLTDYESNANIGSEGDLVDGSSLTDVPSLSLQDTQAQRSQDPNSQDQCRRDRRRRDPRSQDQCYQDQCSNDQCKDPCAQNECSQDPCCPPPPPPRKPRASVQQAVYGFAWRKDNITY